MSRGWDQLWSIKRIWVQYRNKLKGMPLEFVRMTVVEEQEAAQIAKEAFKSLRNKSALAESTLRR